MFEIERKSLFIGKSCSVPGLLLSGGEDFGVLNSAGWQDHRRPNLYHTSKTETVPGIQTVAPSPGAVLSSSVALMTVLMFQGHTSQNLSIILTSLAHQERPLKGCLLRKKKTPLKIKEK